MQLYLCEKYDKDHKISFPYDSDEYWETVEWLVWMVSCRSKIRLLAPTHTTNINKLTQYFLNAAKRHRTNARASQPF